jgi:hypothetical protein
MVSRRKFLTGFGSFAIASLLPSPSFAEDVYEIGETRVIFRTFDYGGGKTYIALHYSERTCVAAAKQALVGRGGRIIQLVHSGGRNISFTLSGTRYAFDPNRIFTEGGAQASLKAIGKKYSLEALKATRAFSAEILRRLHGPIVALHNNTPGALSIKSYSPGGQYAASVADVYEESGMDPDDFLFTTSRSIFSRAVEGKINAALQVRNRIPDDGSLSVYCGQRGIAYVNVEAQSGHTAVQKKMIAAIA